MPDSDLIFPSGRGKGASDGKSTGSDCKLSKRQKPDEQ